MSLRKLSDIFSLEEVLTLDMAVLFALAALAAGGPAGTKGILATNCVIVACIVSAAVLCRNSGKRALTVFRDWYVLVFLITIYLENRTLIPLVNPREYDALVMAADRLVFLGEDPTVLLEKVMHPLLTEFLQLVYASFYLLPLTLCMALYASRTTRNEFHVAASTILMGFYLSYLGYYLMPVAGPRFFMEGLHTKELEGLWTFEFVREALARAEGRMLDCMPSGHALVSVLTTLLAYRYVRSFAPWSLVWTVLLLFSTVYLRYHYVLDLAVGSMLGILVFTIGPRLAIAYQEGSGSRRCVAGGLEIREG
ncbi:MAG TPA: phosphatase PAP2 family protein [Deltaproteobacteria bacterium]|nr:phosphatase PAP2 family protein [Deltaproteobacteria bacterium]HOM28326.1 phosphatase PAP2 family protein [Deltaproteobacteria bacterium]HPP79329.1 phosphatase PAP2 family protein [Deltaproteobacteria bacterium]